MFCSALAASSFFPAPKVSDKRAPSVCSGLDAAIVRTFRALFRMRVRQTSYSDIGLVSFPLKIDQRAFRIVDVALNFNFKVDICRIRSLPNGACGNSARNVAQSPASSPLHTLERAYLKLWVPEKKTMPQALQNITSALIRR